MGEAVRCDGVIAALASDEEEAWVAPPPARESSSTMDALQQPDVLASIMGQLGLQRAHQCAAVSTAWMHASHALVEERRVLRPSHSIGWGNEAVSQFRSPSGILQLPGGEDGAWRRAYR